MGFCVREEILKRKKKKKISKIKYKSNFKILTLKLSMRFQKMNHIVWIVSENVKSKCDF